MHLGPFIGHIGHMAQKGSKRGPKPVKMTLFDPFGQMAQKGSYLAKGLILCLAVGWIRAMHWPGVLRGAHWLRGSKGVKRGQKGQNHPNYLLKVPGYGPCHWAHGPNGPKPPILTPPNGPKGVKRGSKGVKRAHIPLPGPTVLAPPGQGCSNGPKRVILGGFDPF